MDKDRVKGSATNVGGKAKEAAGKVTGDSNVWAGCVSQLSSCTMSEVADMDPAYLIGARAVALMGVRTHLWSH